MGIKAQINQIVAKIDETWSDKVRPQMVAINSNDYFYEDESNTASNKIIMGYQRCH